MAPVLIKKYGNRRLYDTDQSRYLTLDELAAKVRAGADVRVIDDKSGEDLTQATLTQLILESKDAARMLPVPLLVQLVRLGDDALGEFFSRYVTAALDAYQQARRGATSLVSMAPFGGLPLAATDALARMFMASPFAHGFASHFGGAPAANGGPVDGGSPPEPPPGGEPSGEAPRASAPPDGGAAGEIAALRRELEELKRAVGGGGKRRRR